ncbi:hypothetical protein JYU14_05275, partial [Simkania negevensis]|nr:hypothetical protein [Simkania negevensis]
MTTPSGAGNTAHSSFSATYLPAAAASNLSPSHAEEVERVQEVVAKLDLFNGAGDGKTDLADLQQLQEKLEQFGSIPEEELAERSLVKGVEKSDEEVTAEGATLLASEQATFPEQSQLFAHVHADSFAKDTDFEGNTMQCTSRYMKELLSRVMGGKSLLLTQDESTSMKPALEEACVGLEELVPTDRKLLSITGKTDLRKYSEQLALELFNLPPNTRRLIPGGWAGKSGHAMIYSFTKNEDGSYDIGIYNTGEGTKSYHDLLQAGAKTKIRPLVQYKGVRCEEIFFSSSKEEIRAEWIKMLLEQQVLPRIDRYRYEEMSDISAAKIYNNAFGLLEHRRVLANQSTIGFMTAQRAGTCSWRVLTAFLFATLGDKTLYKRIKLEIMLQSLVDFYKSVQATMRADSVIGSQARTLLKGASEKILRAIAKRYDPSKDVNLLSQQEAITAYATAKQVLDQVNKLEERVQLERTSPDKGLPINVQSPPNTPQAEANIITALVRQRARRQEPNTTTLEISSPPYCPFQMPADPSGMKSALEASLFSAQQALGCKDTTTARITLGSVLSSLPIPNPDDPNDYWKGIPKSDLMPCIQAMGEILSLYDDQALPEEKSNVYAAYALIHALSVRYDEVRDRQPEEPRLSEYGINDMGCKELEDPYEIFYQPKEFRRRKEIITYFNRVNKRPQKKLCNFHHETVGKDCLNENSPHTDCLFYHDLLQHHPKLNNSLEEQKAGKSYSSDSVYRAWKNGNLNPCNRTSNEMKAIDLAYTIPQQDNTSPLDLVGLGHLTWLKKSALHAWHAAAHAEESFLNPSKQYRLRCAPAYRDEKDTLQVLFYYDYTLLRN